MTILNKVQLICITVETSRSLLLVHFFPSPFIPTLVFVMVIPRRKIFSQTDIFYWLNNHCDVYIDLFKALCLAQTCLKGQTVVLSILL